MEELDDAEGLLGGWGAEGDTVQGEVIDPPGGTTHTSLLSSGTNHHYLNYQALELAVQTWSKSKII